MQTNIVHRLTGCVLWLALTTTGASAQTFNPAYPTEVEEVMVPYRVGRYTESVAKATAALEKIGTPDRDLLYWRGFAQRRLGHLDGAEKDFAGLGDFVGWKNYPSASKMATDIGKMIELRPPHFTDIKAGKEVVFKVYASEDDAFTRNVVRNLPRGYQAASKFLNSDIREIPVFIFNESEYDRFFKFFSLLYESPPHDWWRILSTHATITVSQKNGKGDVFAPDVSGIAELMTHEMTHVMMRRKLGSIADLPNWFNEGSADMVMASLNPNLLRQNDVRIQKLLDADAILPLNGLTSHVSFHENQDKNKDGLQQAEPYAQGMNMTRYLGYLLQGAKFSHFLDSIAQKRSFNAALQESAGLTPQEFYDSWRRAIQNLPQ